MSFAAHNIWEPFGDDRTANQAAIDALQPAFDLACAIRQLQAIHPGNAMLEIEQRRYVDDVSDDLDRHADRAGVERALFRETIERKLRNDGRRPYALTVPAVPDRAPDDARRRLEAAVLDAEHGEATRLRYLARAQQKIERCGCLKRLDRRTREAQDARTRLAGARDALRDYDRARAGAA